MGIENAIWHHKLMFEPEGRREALGVFPGARPAQAPDNVWYIFHRGRPIGAGATVNLAWRSAGQYAVAYSKAQKGEV